MLTQVATNLVASGVGATQEVAVGQSHLRLGAAWQVCSLLPPEASLHNGLISMLLGALTKLDRWHWLC